MDVLYFLTERTRFIRSFYEIAAAPFHEIMRRIEDGQDPYIPPYSEDGEPPFLNEWMEADTSLEMLGWHCISMLSDSLKLYFSTWESELRFNFQKTSAQEFKLGFIQGYRACFAAALGMEWSGAPSDVDVLEQIVLARNIAQHPREITTLSLQSRGLPSKHNRRPFFVSDVERAAMSEAGSSDFTLLRPTLEINREILFKAIDEVEKFATWLEEKMFDARYPSRTR